jgi:hypothetical protein
VDAIVLLKDDHKVVEKLFNEFEKAGDRAVKTKRRLVDQMPVTWRFRNAMWAVIAKAMMAPAATSVSDVAVFMVGDPFIKDGSGSGHLGAAFCGRAGGSGRLEVRVVVSPVSRMSRPRSSSAAPS